MQLKNSDALSTKKYDWLGEAVKSLTIKAKMSHTHQKSAISYMKKRATSQESKESTHSKPLDKCSLKLIKKSNYLSDNFLKSAKKFKKDKNNMRSDFVRDFTNKLNQESPSTVCGRESAAAWLDKRMGDTILVLLKEHLSNPNHCISKMLKEFFIEFESVYSKICTSSQLKALYEQTVEINNGCLTIENFEDRCQNPDSIADDQAIEYLIEKCFYDVRCSTATIIACLPTYYRNLFSQDVFKLIKERVSNFLLNQYLRGGVYDILFTFSRLATRNEEQELFKCIEKWNLQVDDNSYADLNVIDYLYKQIDPAFRKVEIEKAGFSLTNNHKYLSNPNYVEKSKLSNDASNFDEHTNIRLKYENGAQKLVGMDYCQSPMEKIFMVKLVSESIKQDGQICMEAKDKSLQIWSDTLVSIFAYIVALSRNHLLYAHLHLANSLLGEDIRDQSSEGLYLVILEASLSLLWSYHERTQECLIYMSMYEGEEVDYSKCNTKSISFSPAPRTTKMWTNDFNLSMMDHDESLQQVDFYVSKDFAEFN